MSDYVPTIDDLRVKLCFICHEEEIYDRPENPPRKWIHSCQCTLVAHEECLLEWIKAAQTKSTTTASENGLKCPQCGARYQLESTLPFVMKVVNEAFIKCDVTFRTMGTWFMVAIPVGLVAGIVMGTHYVLTRYGAYVVREFCGDELFNVLLTSDSKKWPLLALVKLPLIPIGLISYRYNATYALFPIISTVLEWPDFQKIRADNLQRIENADFLSWPPSPFTIGFVLSPLTRYLYGKCLDQITHWVLKAPSEGLNAVIEGDERDRILVIRFRQGDRPEERAEDGNQNPGNRAELSVRIFV